VFISINVILAFVPGSMIAWWAHLAGMFVGVLWARVNRRRRREKIRIDGVTGWGSGGPVRYTYTYYRDR
jgi:membrane associated rhomboid family serine protease